MLFGEKLKTIRLSREWSQEHMAAILHTSKQVISRYERGERSPKITTTVKYAKLLGVPSGYLIDENQDALPDNLSPMPAMARTPILGTIACGEPILAQENIEGYAEAPDHIQADFVLRCKGDSMIGARIYDGDLVFIRQQQVIDDGEIAAVLIGDEATLKRVYKIGADRVELRAENPAFPVLRYEGERLSDVRIIGKAVCFLSNVR